LIRADTESLRDLIRAERRSDENRRRASYSAVDHCQRERGETGKEVEREKQASEASGTGYDGGRGEAQTGTTAGLFATRANEPDEAQILIFSMYMDES